MMHITSLQNPDVKYLVKLQDSKERKKYKQCIVQGAKTIRTFLEGSTKLVKLFITEEHTPEALSITDASDIIVVTEAIMKKISTTTTPGGLLGLFTIPSHPAAQALGPGLVLAHLNDPGNTGTLIRAAVACNIKTVVLVEGTDPWSPKVIQASAGTISWIDIFQWDWQTLVTHKRDLELAALVVSNGSTPDVLDPQKTLLVVGNEAHGLPLEWQEECTTRITLPMPGKIESLNAAIAGSLALYWTFVLPSIQKVR